MQFMKQVVTTVKGELSVEHRKLFCVSYKNIVGSRRNAWQLQVFNVLDPMNDSMLVNDCIYRMKLITESYI